MTSGIKNYKRALRFVKEKINRFKMSCKEKQSAPKWISIQDLSYRLGLVDEDIDEWIKRDAPNKSQDHMERPTVPFELLKQYSYSEEYIKALPKALFLESYAMGPDNPIINQRWKEEKLLILKSCYSAVDSLEIIHSKCLQSVNACGYGSKTMAAYLLFTRVISTLKMSCLCQEHDYWHWTPQIREINEGIILAEYFITEGDSTKGKEHLHQWFRENYAPKDLICRKALSTTYAAANSEYTAENHLGLMDELYEKKSKLTHQTFRSIREITKFKLVDGDVIIDRVEYGPIRYQRKLLDMAVFFRSNLITCISAFLACFKNLPLNKSDADELIKIVKKLFAEDTQSYREEGGKY
jgi:hypothetical protein